VKTARGVVGAFLDTGANATDWRSAGLLLLDPELVASAEEKVMHLGGAGGVIEVKQRELRSVGFDLGPAAIRLEKVAVSATDNPGAAKIGMDAVSEFGTFILDFEQMRIDGRLKTAAERKAPARKELTGEDLQLEPKKAADPSASK
jgi:hypothetical protein